MQPWLLFHFVCIEICFLMCPPASCMLNSKWFVNSRLRLALKPAAGQSMHPLSNPVMKRDFLAACASSVASSVAWVVTVIFYCMVAFAMLARYASILCLPRFAMISCNTHVTQNKLCVFRKYISLHGQVLNYPEMSFWEGRRSTKLCFLQANPVAHRFPSGLIEP